MYMGNWVRKGLDISGNVYDQFGWSISFSEDGNKLAVGAYADQFKSQDKAYVRIYEFISNTWTPVGDAIEADNYLDGTGSSVCMNAEGSIVAIASHLDNDAGISAGKIKVYTTDSSTSIESHQALPLSVYPNPFNTHLFIKNENDDVRQYHVSLFNSVGQLKFASNNVNRGINTAELPAGVYMLSVDSGEESRTFKIIK